MERAGPGPVGVASSSSAGEKQDGGRDRPPVLAPHSPTFDPYAFSAMAVLVKEGREALVARVEAVATADALRRLAAAQSVRLPAELLDDPATPPARLREAFVAAVEQRLAHRKAVTG